MMNSAARIVFSSSMYNSITPLFTQHASWRCRSGLGSSWLFWYTDAYTTQLRRTSLRNSTSRLLSRLVSVSALLHHHPWSSDVPVVQPSAIDLFPSLLPHCGTLQGTSRRNVSAVTYTSKNANIKNVILYSMPLPKCQCTAEQYHIVYICGFWCVMAPLTSV